MTRHAIALERFLEWTLKHEESLQLKNGLTYRIVKLGIHDLFVVWHGEDFMGRWNASQVTDFLLRQGAPTVDS